MRNCLVRVVGRHLWLGALLVVVSCGGGSPLDEPSLPPPNSEEVVAATNSDVPTPGAGQARILLPIEVIGPEGYTRTLRFSLADADARQPLRLSMQVHGLTYENKGSLRLNGGSWVSFNNAAMGVEGLGNRFGGIGGAFSTLKIHLELVPGTLQAGINAVAFRFDRSDGSSVGYRVLNLNVIRPDGSEVLPRSLFIEDEPSTWEPPLPEREDIAAGEVLWRTKALLRSSRDRVPIQARCMDCHTRDGRDLKYFGYSNRAIIQRSMFHGLTEKEGMQIASYIRALDGVPSPGRPWNPPYQPGPGLDSRPIQQWAAGAGVDAVLDHDHDILAPLFPIGISKGAIQASPGANVREIPVPLQLPDWNHWLPTIHPKDAWGAEFANARLNTLYDSSMEPKGASQSIRGLARSVQDAAYENYRDKLYFPANLWAQSLYEFLKPRYQDVVGERSAEYSQKIYSTALWQMVKTWEVMQEFGLEGHQRSLHPSSREAIGWMPNVSFDSSPNLLKIPRDATGINGGRPLLFSYFSLAWYQLSLVLFHGNHADGSGRDGQRPIDWGYVHNFISEVQWSASSDPLPLNGLLTLWLIKGMQVASNGLGPQAPFGRGWAPQHAADISRFVAPQHVAGWSESSEEERRAILQSALEAWWDKSSVYDISDWRQAGLSDPAQVLTGNADGSLADRVWYMLPRFKHFGVDPMLIGRIADWGQLLWPTAPWHRVKSSECISYRHHLLCSTDEI